MRIFALLLHVSLCSQLAHSSPLQFEPLGAPLSLNVSSVPDQHSRLSVTVSEYLAARYIWTRSYITFQTKTNSCQVLQGRDGPGSHSQLTTSDVTQRTPSGCVSTLAAEHYR